MNDPTLPSRSLKDAPVSQVHAVEYLESEDNSLSSVSHIHHSSGSSDETQNSNNVFRGRRRRSVVHEEEEFFLVLKRANPINEYRDNYDDVDSIQSALKRHRISYDIADEREDTQVDVSAYDQTLTNESYGVNGTKEEKITTGSGIISHLVTPNGNRTVFESSERSKGAPPCFRSDFLEDDEQREQIFVSPKPHNAGKRNILKPVLVRNVTPKS